MQVKIIEDKITWDKFFNENGSPSFLQSWEWGEFQEKVGESVLRLGVYEDKDLIAIAQIIKIKAKRGNFLLIPHGPVTIQNSEFKIQYLIKSLRNYLIQIAKSEGYLFIRIAPILENIEENKKIFQELGFKIAPIYIHTERSWILNLTESIEERSGKTESVYKSDDKLLSDMRKTTRYLIKKAIRDGVVVEKNHDEKAIDNFWEIYLETAKRENFSPFSKKFIIEEFEAFHKTSSVILLSGKYQGKVLASALIVFTKSTAFYHQGASIHTKIPATYLLQWEAIREAKKRGCRFYNFWGVSRPGRTPKTWGGLTLFKQGFGGQQIDYVLTHDYVLSPKYYLTYFYEKYLAWKRGV